MSEYNNMIYNSGPVKVSDFLSNVPNEVHAKLYEDALSKFMIDHPEFNGKNFNIIENKSKEYWMPSYINIIDYSKQPKKRYTYWLGEYWNAIYVEKNEDNIEESLYGDNLQIDYLDYVNGKAKLQDRYNTIKMDVKFDKLNENIELSDNYNVYPTTFQNLRNHGGKVWDY